MLVIAKVTGFYDGKRRRAGDVFDVKNGAKAAWFEPVADTKPAPKKVEAKEPATFSELNKQAVAAEEKAAAGKTVGGKPL